MTSLSEVADRYEAAALAAAGAIEVLAIADAAGAHFDAALRCLIGEVRQESPEIWHDLLAMARQLRWRLATNPAPAPFRSGESELVEALTTSCQSHRLSVDGRMGMLLDDLEASARAAHGSDRPARETLLSSLGELGYESCVVLAASARAQHAIRDWFDNAEIAVAVLYGTQCGKHSVVEQAYAVGSPSLFGPALVTAPRARAVSYLISSWIGDRTLPVSAFADFADGGIRPRIRIFRIGREHSTLTAESATTDDPLLPQPAWPQPLLPGSIGCDEVEARKVMLGGGLSIMLDQDGEHIRCLYPERPAGQRVELGDVSAVATGSYLVLREGATLAATLYDLALELMQERGPRARASQQEWKQALERHIDILGLGATVTSLRKAGIKRADRARAWTAPTMVRPQDTGDFELLLEWLELPRHPHLELANELRRARLQASQNVRGVLEDAVSRADLASLARDGFMRLEPEQLGLRGIIATRVLAISPDLQPVSRTEVRVPFTDRSALWLE